MRILGIDPGLTRCGWGAIDRGDRRQLTMVDVGVITTAAATPLEQRLLHIQRALDDVIEATTPDVIVVEQVFAQDNVGTVMGVAQVSGLALVAAAGRGIEVNTRTPSEAKAAVTGYGGAQKAQVGHMVMRLLSLDEVPRPADAADALALAITHALRPALNGSGDQGTLTAAQRQWLDASAAARRGPRKS